MYKGYSESFAMWYDTEFCMLEYVKTNFTFTLPAAPNWLVQLVVSDDNVKSAMRHHFEEMTYL